MTAPPRSHRSIALELMNDVFDGRQVRELEKAKQFGSRYTPTPMSDEVLLGLATVHALLAIEERLAT